MANSLPPNLQRLHDLAQNVWWSWTPQARELFEQFDPALWRLTHHNPIKQLQEASPDHLMALSRNALFLRQYEAAVKAYDDYMSAKDHWFGVNFPHLQDLVIAYFSAEFGLHISVPIYSGGLGILAGDHLKEASDLGIPIVGIGFMYSHAYFRQVVNPEGWQEAVYEPFDRSASPIRPSMTPAGTQVKIQITVDSRTVTCLVWQVQVGRVKLYLLDTDTAENNPADRELSARLYGGDHTTRLVQEYLLGVGGVRALRALGISPGVWHANEGHPAFMVLERIRELVKEGQTLSRAKDLVKGSTVFTTHTPVPAGHDMFHADLIRTQFAGYWEELGLTFEDFMGLGKHPHYSENEFHMTALAIGLASSVNGVSREHARVSRAMFADLWPGLPENRVPIQAVTNGIHIPTWIAPEMNQLYSKYLGPAWRDQCDDPALWQRVLEIPDHEIWEIRQLLKRKLLNIIRLRSRSGWMRGNLEAIQVLANGALFEPYPLTIGFCRRFATYKRATLIFRDVDRLRELLLNRWRPVQLVFAGKAHPADHPGRQLIHEVYQFAKSHGFAGHIAFVEDYDMHVAKFLVRGVDVWLNNPRPPLEASGTSGQKAAVNGVPNLSGLDGWWKEGYDGSNGWSIPLPSDPLGEQDSDTHDAEALYALLEKEVIPLYYERDADGVPHGWIKIIKNSIKSIVPYFNTQRMLKEYTTEAYVPACPNGYAIQGQEEVA